MKQGMMKKIMVTGLCVSMIATIVGCGEQQQTTGGENGSVMNAFVGLPNKTEMSFVQTTMDDMGTNNLAVPEISFVYQNNVSEMMINGDMNGVQHFVYNTGTAYFTLQADGKQYIRDICADDELLDYYSSVKSYMSYFNFKSIALVGNSNVDNILCQKYYGECENNGFYGFNGYETIKQTVYVRIDTNSVFYVEEQYVDNDNEFNPVNIQVKYFEETVINVPTAIANAMSREDFLAEADGETGIVAIDELEEDVQDRLVAGYYYADGSYSAEPVYSQDWVRKDEENNEIEKYAFMTDTWTNLATGEMIENYFQDVINNGEEGEFGVGISLLNFITYGGADTKTKTLPQLISGCMNQAEATTLDIYTIDQIVVLDDAYTWTEEMQQAVVDYANNKTVGEILSDAQNWNNLSDNDKAIVLIVSHSLNGYIEKVNGSYRDIYSLVKTYANIDEGTSFMMMMNYYYAPAEETENIG